MLGVTLSSMISDGIPLGVSILIVDGVLKVGQIVDRGLKSVSYQNKPCMTHPLSLLCHSLAKG